jgi:hypothetical protein
MKISTHSACGWISIGVLAAASVWPAGLMGQDEAQKGQGQNPYTLEEALGQLQLYPKDAGLQYIALQLGRREGRVQEVVDAMGRLTSGRNARFDPGRRNDVDLFSIFTGALAVQESLQLDTMRGGSRRPAPMRGTDLIQPGQSPEEAEKSHLQALENRRKEIVEVSALTGPTIKSHPWEEMLGKERPDIGLMAKNVPDDFFFAEFRSLNKCLDVLDSGDLWAKHLLHQTAGEARSQQVGDRLKRQLAVETNPLVRPFYDLVVEDVAVTGSDLFFNEGSDLTLLFRFKQPEVFKARMNGFLVNAEKADKLVKRTVGKFGGFDYVHLTNPDRSVHVFSAYPQPNLHVRSNSLVAFQRILSAIQGKTPQGSPVRRLGDSAEFAYIRTLMKRGDKTEDGFLYLSDPFIRRLVGPALKLTARRRMLCYNHLRMIAHASLMYQSEFGKSPESLAALTEAQCAPGLFGDGELACPNGGKYALTADGAAGVCSLHGHAHDLVPCCEHLVSRVTGEEADEYQAFLTEYNSYWRTFFDPIAIRIQVAPEQYRLETIILPLIDNSIYQGMSFALGGKPEPLDALPVPERNIFSVNFRLNKQKLAALAGITDAEPERAKTEELGTGKDVLRIQSVANLRQIGLALHNYHSVNNQFPPAAVSSKEGKPLLSWRVALLPFLDEAVLYSEFHLNEPWDSEHNKKLIERMPAFYRSLSAQVKQPNKTTYLAPVGQGLMFTKDEDGTKISSVTDGLSNTILVVQADDEHAVAWTSPQDLAVDLKKPAAGLVNYPAAGHLVLFADGATASLRAGLPDATAAALFTRNGSELVNLSPPDVSYEHIHQPSGRPFWLWGLRDEQLDGLQVPRLLLKGLGNQVGLHVYDSTPTFDFNFPSFLGEAFGSFNSRGAMMNEVLPISFLIASLNAPVYASVPVQDASIVDDFLERLDGVLATLARQAPEQGWFRIQNDFYRFKGPRGNDIRCQSMTFGPVKFRIFWSRVGDGLYIASKSFILEDLGSTGKNATSTGPSGHGMFAIRSRNWEQVLPEYRLGWAENNRRACLDNLGPLSSAARAHPELHSGTEVCRRADRLHGVHFFCPDGGRYELAADGKSMTCSVHGSALTPRQESTPAKDQALGKLIAGFTGLEATLTFLEDGLHAVVTISRK